MANGIVCCAKLVNDMSINQSEASYHTKSTNDVAMNCFSSLRKCFGIHIFQSMAKCYFARGYSLDQSCAPS